MTTYFGEDDLAAMLAEIGVEVVHDGTTTRGLVDEPDEQTLADSGVGGVVGTKRLVTIATGSLPGLAFGSPLEVEGVEYRVRHFLKTEDGATTVVLVTRGVGATPDPGPGDSQVVAHAEQHETGGDDPIENLSAAVITSGLLALARGGSAANLSTVTPGNLIRLNSAGTALEDAGINAAAAGGGVTDHGALTGLGDDDHTQYHTAARALSWLGTRSTSDLPEGTNLYHTAARADARADARIAAAIGVSVQGYDADLTTLGAGGSAARAFLGLVIGTDVQAYSAALGQVAGLTPSNDDVLQRKAGAWTNRTLAQLAADLGISGSNTGDETAAGILTKLLTVDGAGSGLDADTVDGQHASAFAAAGHDHSGVYQPADADLTALAALTTTAYGRALLELADAAAGRTALGLGSLATASTINGGNWSGADLAVADGGTGASDAATARTNLGLAIGTNVQAYDAGLASFAALPTVADRIAYSTAADTWAEATLTSFGRSLIAAANASAAGSTLGLSSLATLTPGTGITSFLATPTSATLRAALTDETGTGAAVFADGPTLIAPVLGTPASGTLSNCGGLPVATGISGLASGIATFLQTPSSANLAAALTDETGSSGGFVRAGSPTFTGVSTFATIAADQINMDAGEKLNFDAGTGAYYIARVAANNNVRIARAEGGAFAGSVDVTQAAFVPTSGTAMALGGASNGWSGLYLDETGAGTDAGLLQAPSSLASGVVWTLPASTGTIALTSDMPTTIGSGSVQTEHTTFTAAADGNVNGNFDTTAANVFPSAKDAFSAAALTTYFFEAAFYVTKANGTNPHNARLQFDWSGTGTLLCNYWYHGSTGSSAGGHTNAIDGWGSSGAAIQVSPNVSTVTESIAIRVSGTFTTPASTGSITPKLSWNASPGDGSTTGRMVISNGSWMRVWVSDADGSVGSGWA